MLLHPQQHSRRWLGTLILAVHACLLLELRLSSAVDLLPDLVPIEDAQRSYMHNGEFDTVSAPGRVYFRFDAVLANLGEGPFQIFETTDLVQQTQDIYQDIFDSSGAFRRELINTFDFEPPIFGHLSFDSLARYTLYEVTPGDGVGAVVATADKTSHAVVDSVRIDGSLPGAPASHVYSSALDNPLGISVGYADLYGRNISTQRIDVTGVPSGQYWLEVVVDPLGYVQETDDSNNVEQILVDLIIPTTGDYNQDSDVDGDDFMMWQNGRSPNLFSADDLASWLINFGTSYPPPLAASAAVVPEPGAFVLFVTGCLLACDVVRSRPPE